MTQRTATYRLIETLMKQPLDEYVTTLRDDERSWSYIARQIRHHTGVTVSDESLRSWFTSERAA